MRRRFFACLLLAAWCGGVWFFLDWAALPPAPSAAQQGIHLDWDTFFNRYLLATLPVASHFDSPLRPPDGKGAFLAKPFAFKGHAGEDWNTAVGNGDLGEPVYSPSDGWVSLAMDFQGAWGKVILVDYRLKDDPKLPVIEMMFAHLSEIDVRAGQFVQGGQRIGKMGNADGVYAAHLHLEVRKILGLGLGGAYADDLSPWLDSSAFLTAHHGTPLLTKRLPESEWERWGGD